MRQAQVMEIVIAFLALVAAIDAYKLNRVRAHDCSHLRRAQAAANWRNRILVRVAQDAEKLEDGDEDVKPVKAGNDVESIDLSKLSDKQMLQLLQFVQTTSKGGSMGDAENMEATTWLEELNAAADDGERGTKRPWKKVQRIIRRQLIKIPKRYLKKFLRQWGLGRSQLLRTAEAVDGRGVWMLTAAEAQPVGLLMHGAADTEDDREIVELKGNLVGENYVLPLNR